MIIKNVTRDAAKVWLLCSQPGKQLSEYGAMVSALWTSTAQQDLLQQQKCAIALSKEWL